MILVLKKTNNLSKNNTKGDKLSTPTKNTNKVSGNKNCWKYVFV